MNFSEMLKIYRTKKGYTQQKMANLLEITNSTYSGYETGRSQPSIDKIRKIVNILGVPADILLETKFAEEASQDKEKELIAIFGETTRKEKEMMAIFRKLDERDQDELLHTANYKLAQNKNTPPR